MYLRAIWLTSPTRGDITRVDQIEDILQRLPHHHHRRHHRRDAYYPDLLALWNTTQAFFFSDSFLRSGDFLSLVVLTWL